MGVDHLLGLKPHIHWDWHIEMLAAMEQNYLNGPFLGSDQALGSFVSFCQQHKGNKKHIIFFCFHPNVMAIPKIPQGFCFNTSDHGHPWPSMTCQDPTQFTLRGPAGRSSSSPRSRHHTKCQGSGGWTYVERMLNMELQPVSEISELFEPGWCVVFLCANLKFEQMVHHEGDTPLHYTSKGTVSSICSHQVPTIDDSVYYIPTTFPLLLVTYSLKKSLLLLALVKQNISQVLCM